MAAPTLQPLFVLPIPPTPPTTQPTGQFVCTQPVASVYLLSFSSPPDNRLTPAFNSTFLLALDIIAHRLPPGVVITTSSITKFYSNGLDYAAAVASPSFFPTSLYPLWRRLVTYPLPTIALVNGHAFAGGLMTAMMHDYRIMNPHKGYACVNELDFGASFQPPMATVFRTKIPMAALRTMALESRRLPALEALKEGVVDGLGGLKECLAFVAEMNLVQKAQAPSYGRLKEELYREIVRDLDEVDRHPQVTAQRDLDRSRRDAEAKRRVEEYAAAAEVKAKL